MSIDSDTLEINPDMKVTTRHIGAGKHKIVIADDFYKHPKKVVDLALSLSYCSEPTLLGNYPGDRAFVSLDTDPMLEALGKAWGEPVERYVFQPATFSRIKQGPETLLNWGQRQPHLDAGLTCMVYLNEEAHCHGGTAIYRHKLSGLERVPIEVNQELMEFCAQNGYHPAKLQQPHGLKAFEEAFVLNPLFALRENRYPNDGTEFWEMICLIKMRFNRMVLFDGRMPHSMHLDLDKYHDVPRLNQILYLKGSDEE